MYALTRRLGRHRLVVLCYHGVVDDRLAPDACRTRVAISASQFRSQLQFLQEQYHLISLADLHWLLENECPLPHPSALITFDDGFRNNLSHAVPILEQLGIPAAFFVSTAYVGSDHLLWPHLIDEIVLDWSGAALPAPDGLSELRLADWPRDRVALAEHVRHLAQRLPDEARRSYVEMLSGDRPVSMDSRLRELNAFMDWSDLRELARRGFDIGSHTVDHPILARLSPEQLVLQLQQSRRDIESELGCPCTSIAYPNGGPDDVSQDVFQAARHAGYRTGFTLCGRPGDPRRAPLAIDRVGIVRDLTLDAFEARLSGLAALYHQWHRRIG
jgi:peptidoglycan/xylan/chitin deacetylase (PgdA/CDA1 family)